MKRVMKTVMFTAGALSNEQYRELPELSGSDLVKVWQTSVANWAGVEQKESRTLTFGIEAHMALLEPEEFHKNYYRTLNPEEQSPYQFWNQGHIAEEQWLITGKDLQSKIKNIGIKPGSGKTVSELKDIIRDAGLSELILSDAEDYLSELMEGKTAIPHMDYDKITDMREAIQLKPEAMEIISDALNVESSIVNSELGLKVRPDLYTKGHILCDYKTTRSVKPEAFGKQAHDAGYWLKMALQSDLCEKQFQRRPEKVVLIAQEKEPPYLCEVYELTEEQLEVGREQYQRAQRQIVEAIESGELPGYSSGITPLYTPNWLAAEYGFIDDDSISDVED